MKIENLELQFDGIKVVPSQGLLNSLKSIMYSTIMCMRKASPENKECWYCGSCTIGDLASSQPFTFQYGSKEDRHWIDENSHVFIKVDF